MLRFASSVRRFLASEEGPTAVEYAIMLALIILACFVAIEQLGSVTQNTFSNVSNNMSGS
ncbi:MAG: Flp family type IVb pilin [Deltaproteobacteria bacterium]